MTNKIIILHGWTKNKDKWQTFLDILKTKGIKTEFPNIPGLTEGLNKVWKLENYIQWLKNITDKEKGKVILIGHSNGGRIALNFAIKYPEKVEKLILIDSAGIYHNELSLALKRVIFRTLAKFGKKLISSNILKNILYKLAGENDYKNASINMKQTMLNLLNSDKSLKPEKIQTPTLIIWGGKDKITSLSDGLLMNKMIDSSELVVLENAYHSPMFTHAKEVTDVVLKQFNNTTI